jgi:nucleoside-diphosphate kinase
MIEKTLILIKPDAIQRGITSDILNRFERKGLKIAGIKMVQLTEELLKKHYAHVYGQDFFAELHDFMVSTPIIAAIIEGANAIEMVRTIAGTNHNQMGTIRGDFADSRQRNLIHTSDSIENAAEEIPRFFTKNEIFDYKKVSWKYSYSKKDIQENN